MRGHFNSTFLADSVTALVPFLYSNKARFFNQSDCSLYLTLLHNCLKMSLLFTQGPLLRVKLQLGS